MSLSQITEEQRPLFISFAELSGAELSKSFAELSKEELSKVELSKKDCLREAVVLLKSGEISPELAPVLALALRDKEPAIAKGAKAILDALSHIDVGLTNAEKKDLDMEIIPQGISVAIATILELVGTLPETEARLATVSDDHR